MTISRWSSPIPQTSVWPVWGSVVTRIVGSSLPSLARAAWSLPCSTLHRGSTVTEMTGSGNVIDSRTIGPVLGAERVAGREALHRPHGHDVAGEDLLDLFPLVGVHLEEARYPLLLVLDRIVEDRPGVGFARIDPEKGQRAHEAVVLELEDQRREGLVVGAAARLGLARPGVVPGDRRNVGRGGQIVDDGVEERLDPLVAEGGAVEHGHDPAGDRRLADGPPDVFGRRRRGLRDTSP